MNSETGTGEQHFIARQPILDQNMRVYAYELLYRSNDRHNAFDSSVQADQASSETIMASFQSMGIQNITRGRRAFVNFTYKLIDEDVASLFPKEQLVIEILEDVPPTEGVIEKIRQLKEMGYTIALDDYTYSPEMKELNALADIVKIDFLSMTIPEVKKTIAHFRKKKVQLLAEKVETQEVFEAAKAMGFTLFQGYFFAQPTIVTGRRIDPLKINYIQLIRHVNKDEMDFQNLAEVIRRDVALSFKMLRLINSAYYGVRNEIKDIQYALAYLGEEAVRKWVSLIAMARCCEGKVDEIIYQSVIRARFMERFGQLSGKRNEGENLFLTGLFSMIDIVMDTPMEEIIESLYVSAEVSEALVQGKGYPAEVLRVICLYEVGMWDESVAQAQTFGVEPHILPELYMEAVQWSSELQV